MRRRQLLLVAVAVASIARARAKQVSLSLTITMRRLRWRRRRLVRWQISMPLRLSKREKKICIFKRKDEHTNDHDDGQFNCNAVPACQHIIVELRRHTHTLKTSTLVSLGGGRHLNDSHKSQIVFLCLGNNQVAAPQLLSGHQSDVKYIINRARAHSPGR